MDDESLALTAMYAAGVCGLLGLTAPWLALFVSRMAAAVTAGVLSATGTVAFLVSNVYMPAKYNIRVDLLFLPPLLLASWVVCIGLSAAAVLRKKRDRTSHAVGDPPVRRA